VRRSPQGQGRRGNLELDAVKPGDFPKAPTKGKTKVRYGYFVLLREGSGPAKKAAASWFPTSGAAISRAA